MNDKTISQVMSYLGKRGVEARHKGKTKKQISEMYSKISNMKNEKFIEEVQRKNKVV